ncbi:conserved hypothetical protein [Talaromyces stipitatus ATCC 10500]|uniref:DNA mismatch repair protein HSM3 N-terminal domain-containing protein n=1 Tax=Talaromyces stipitatus (strain ATCC 10500 / CBS 375.48 / QM 6759 / NRRL 1006) TaxID=441959 RepID=B8MR96_TALSN|nr:uncharacterized protein TSTA_054980 [Talaromyces stipitatus ATCC 10500]EED12990.1 conserved hypothetical protein [Talaromyces stipitatus ATCC 10500]
MVEYVLDNLNDDGCLTDGEDGEGCALSVYFLSQKVKHHKKQSMTTPSSYAAVKSNLDAILADPSTAFDETAIEKLKLELTEQTASSIPASILAHISQVLPVLQYDPTLLTTLGIRATAFLKFSDLQALDPPLNLLAGIQAPSPPVNLLTLSLLAKANRLPSDAAIIAGDSDLVATLVELWLSTPNTEVAQAAVEVLWSLLEVDHVETETVIGSPQNIAAGQGLLWRRIFTDKDVYGLLFSICSLTNTETTSGLSKREKTVAQGRLLDFIVKVGTLRWDCITEPQVPEVEAEYRSKSLLEFAACHMVDTSDVLMHMTLLNFFRELVLIDAPGLKTASPPHKVSPFSSRSLDFVIEKNLHQRVLGYYLDPSQLDSINVTFLASPVMAYVAQYAQLYPNHLLNSPRELLDKILSRIHKSLGIPSAQWAHGDVPLGDLTILSSLPRVMLVEASRRSLNPLQAVPFNPPNSACYQTLARVFHGPSSVSGSLNEAIIISDAPTDVFKESVAARILYFTYLNEHANLWQCVVTAADIVAMKDTALAAISLIGAVITANWRTMSTEDAQHISSSPFKLPSEEDLNQQPSTGPGLLPTSGSWAVLTPPALTTVLPYLFKPPLSYSNFVAGGSGDPENAVWKLATAKYDVLVDLHKMLKDSTAQVEGFADIVRTLEQRIRDGPQGPAMQVGSRVEALEL